MVVRYRDLVREEIKRILRNYRNLAVLIGFAIFMSLVPAVVFRASMDDILKNLGIYDKRALIAVLIDLFFFTYAASVAMFIIQSVSMDIFISDKKERAFEVLLTLPLTLRRLWLAKSISLFIAGYVTSLLTTVVFILSVNVLSSGDYRYTPRVSLWIYSVTLLPLLIFLVSSLAGLLQMSTKRYSSVNFFLFLIAFAILGIPSFLVDRIVFISADTFLIIHSCIAAALLASVAILERVLLEKERVILSS